MALFGKVISKAITTSLKKDMYSIASKACGQCRGVLATAPKLQSHRQVRSMTSLLASRQQVRSMTSLLSHRQGSTISLLPASSSIMHKPVPLATSQALPWQQQQVRHRSKQGSYGHKYHKSINWISFRDLKKRHTVKKYAAERTRLTALRKNDILPESVKDMATVSINELPRNSRRTRIVNRCILTGRARGVRKRWYMQRMMLRRLMDYNQMAGMTRSSW